MESRPYLPKKKSKHALHDAANRDGPQWDEFQVMRGVVQEVVNWKDTLDPFMKELNLNDHTGSNFILIVVARAISNFSKNHTVLICKI